MKSTPDAPSPARQRPHAGAPAAGQHTGADTELTPTVGESPRVSRAVRTPPAPVSGGPGLDRRGLQRLQRAAGNAAVSRLVAQRYAAPVKPSPAQAPGFRRVKADVGTKKQTIKQHQPATTESRSAQDAAVAPPDDKEAQGKAAQAEKMNAAKPGEFNKQAFIDAVNKAIADQAPKNLNEADKFADSGKADQVREQVDGKVTDGKKTSAKDIETTTKAAPDTSKAKTKKVTPMTADKPPGNPGAPSADDAVPDKQPPEVTDFSDGPRQNDKAMADAEVTEEQLAKGNEPQFDEALSEKKKAEEHSKKAGPQSRQAEDAELADAKAGAAAAGASAMASLTATRSEAGQKVDGGKGETKSKDEKKREEVTAKLQKVFDATKKDVESTLEGLDKKVDDQFTKGEKAAKDAFTEDHKRRMKKYKDKRYSGFRGKLRWVKDKFKGLPEEGLNIFKESRKLYVSTMQGVISSIADTIGTELGKAKARIKQGRAELKAEVDKLPEDLKKYGQEAAKDFEGKFEDLETKVNDKSDELVQTLAQKYTEALNKVDDEIKKLQDANKGLIAKAKDAIVGAIKTIMELKNLLMGILAKAASAIGKIIKDPIGFLGNLVKAVGAGLSLFTSNILDHLKKGLVAWLLGTATKEGIEIPAKFDMKGIIQLVGSMLGLTWDNLRARIVGKGVPEPAMEKIEQSVPVAGALSREGPAGAMDEMKADTGDLKTKILDDLKAYLVPTVIIAGISWIVSLLTPASAFVRAVKGIIDIITFIVNQGAQIVDFVNAVLDAVIAIAGGGSAGVPKMVEAALAASIPLLIGFLAALVGVGGLANKVKSVLRAAGRPVKRAIGKLVGVIARKGRAIWGRLRKERKKDQKAAYDTRGKANRERKAEKIGNETRRGESKREAKGTHTDRDRAKGKESKSEAAALADADRALAAADSHDAAVTGVRTVERKRNVPLHLIVDSTTPEGEVVHVQTARTPQHTLRDENQTRNEIKSAMRDKHNNTLIQQAHLHWWNTYISKVREGPLPTSPQLFHRKDLDGTENDAQALTQADDFVDPLLGYFKGNRKTAQANDFYNHVFGSQNPQRKTFLKALGSPVPEELARLAASRLPSIADESFRVNLEEGMKQLGPDSYKVDVSPYGRFDLPSLRKKEHSDYFPLNIDSVTCGDTVTTTYTTRAGKKFTVIEKGKGHSKTLTIKGADLTLKPRGAPRGITQTPAGFVEGEEFNRAHGIADMFGGSGFKEGLNLVSTSDHYNKRVQGPTEGEIEGSIRSFAEKHGVDVSEVSMDLTVTITFGEMVSEILKDKVTSLPWYLESDPESQQRFTDLLTTVSNPPIQRVEKTEYEYTLKTNGESGPPDPPVRRSVGADEWLFVRRSAS
ncbi:hypothetical protein [Streptomyces buecherae]|uniref:hypothetical protein n=1 Tax=Streptomyces buecherae TaxID=2763006 RepID=UPI0027E27A99|nr:hypothetical protein [Streptomyces buecherae]